jgi:protein-S-isoprenylcysteine O-methyltransferase Ste14
MAGHVPAIHPAPLQRRWPGLSPGHDGSEKAVTARTHSLPCSRGDHAVPMTDDWHDRPNRIPWPPIIFAGIVVAALLLHAVVPLGDTLPRAVRLIGAAIMLAGIVLDVAAMVTMHRHRANIQPHRAATALVTTGPFALSRNPIYLGNTLLIAGAGIAFDALWFVPTALLGAWLVSRLAIRREEAHLAARFGPAWAAYAQRTPRWLRLRR